MTPPLSVFLMAFACEPNRGSEPGVGWVFTEALAEASKRNGWQAFVVTRPHRCALITEELRRAGMGHVSVLPVPVPRLFRLRGARDVRIASLVWQRRAVSRVRRRMRQMSGSVVVHHATFATEAVPTFEDRLRDRAALVFGPAGSTNDAADGGVKRRLRAFLSRAAVQRSDVLIAVNEQVGTAWRARGTSAAVIVEPNIVAEAVEQGAVEWDVAIVGQLIPRKRVALALQAVAATGKALRVAVVGDGPLRAELEELVVRLDMTQVSFTGTLAREDAIEVLSRTHLLLHASAQEGSPWVIGEAQAAGARVVAIAGTGADDLARVQDGVVVERATVDALAEGVREALSSDRALPSSRWSSTRLPGLLEHWYAEALGRASERVRTR